MGRVTEAMLLSGIVFGAAAIAGGIVLINNHFNAKSGAIRNAEIKRDMSVLHPDGVVMAIHRFNDYYGDQDYVILRDNETVICYAGSPGYDFSWRKLTHDQLYYVMDSAQTRRQVIGPSGLPLSVMRSYFQCVVPGYSHYVAANGSGEWMRESTGSAPA